MNGKLQNRGLKGLWTLFKSVLFVLGGLLVAAPLAKAQTFYMLTQGNRLSTIDVASCTKTFITGINTPNTLTDIAFTPDGRLWGVNGQGQIYEINPANGNTSLEGITNDATPDFITSLVGSEDGQLYSAAENGNLYAFDPDTGEASFLGNVGFGASGDLTFAEGTLVMAAYGNQMIAVDLENIQNSTPLLSFSTSTPVFGIVTIVEGCDEVYTYASTSGSVGRIYAIDFETEVLTLVCQANERIYGAASEQEFLAAAPVSITDLELEPSICSGSNGMLTIEAESGSGGLTYSLNGVDFQSSNTFSGLPPGMYTVYVMDALGCTDEREVELPATGLPAVANLDVQPTRCGASNGAIAFVVEGGTAPYSFALNGGSVQSIPSFSNLDSGTYELMVEDALGCSTVFEVEIDASMALELQVEAVACGLGKSLLRLSTSGGSGVGRLFRLNGGASQTSALFENLDSGTFSVSATDSNGCTAEVQTEIPESAALTLQLDDLQPCGPGQGALTVSGQGGTPPLTYQLNGGEDKSFGRFEGLSAGAYTLRASDANGCVADPLQVELPAVSPLGLQASILQPERCGNADGQLEMTATGGTPPYRYFLGTQLSDSGQFSQLAAGATTAVVRDSNGCLAQTSLLVPVSCPVYAPTAFSPNDDGRNDRFVLYSGLPFQVQRYRIYDRWGAMVYEAKDFSSSADFRFWDGAYAGRMANTGLYVYQVEIRDASGKQTTLQGEVMLVR